MGDTFNPFDDTEELPPPTENPTRVLDSRTQVQAPRAEGTQIVERTRMEPKAKGLDLEFDELADQGGDVRGASAIGGENLSADEFLTGMKRRDHDDALEKARRAQVQIGEVVSNSRVARTVKTPLYLLALGALLFVGALILGGIAFNAYEQHVERVKIQALQNAN
jgi:hypothetical protein